MSAEESDAAAAELDWYRDRTAILATMHRKEQVIAPLFAEAFALPVVVLPEFDTDQFGTFTGEVERCGTQLEAARAKVDAALALSNVTLAIASEGSFGPHPQFPWVASNREIVLLKDAEHHFEVYGECLSLETNYDGAQVRSWEEAQAFAQKIHFPSHGMVIKRLGNGSQWHIVAKGITDGQTLRDQLEPLFTAGYSVRLEPDMRALYNPTRMKTIQQATQALITKLKQLCPACSCPGFDIAKTITGLPCAWCYAPTGLVQAELWRCHRCSFEHRRQPQAQKFADPGHCPVCNP
ncbi:MAG TPA: DUF6671 family protein [Stenomitos sp.]